MSDIDFCEKLVQAVEKHECLYNYELPDRSNKHVINKAWTQVGEEVNEDPVKCKEKWRNIRIVFLRHLKVDKIRKRKRSPYYLYSMLDFLIPHLKPTTASPPSENQVVKNENIEVIRNNVQIEEKGENDESEIEQTEVDEPSTKQKCKRNVTLCSRTSNEKKKQEFLEVQETFNRWVDEEKEDNRKKAFITSILPDLHDMNDQQFRQFRRRVLALIDEIIDSRSTTNASVQTDLFLISEITTLAT